MKWNLKHKHLYYSFFLVGFLLPLPMNVSRIGFIVLSLSLVLSFAQRKKSFASKDHEILLLILLASVLWTFCSMFLHPPLYFGPFEKLIILILLPALFLYYGPVENKLKSIWKKGFILGNICLAVTNLILATYHSLRNENSEQFFDSTVWGNISVWESVDHVGNYFFSFYFANSIHPSYWALFLTIAVLFLWLDNPFKGFQWTQRITILFFLIMIYLCSSRAGIIGLTLALVIIVVSDLIERKKKWQYLMVGTAIILISLTFFLNPRMVDTIHSWQDGSYKTSQRWQAWESAVTVIKDNYLLGVGSQNAESTMLAEYQKRGLVRHYELQLNAHNQFLETTLNDGVVGLSLLVIIFTVGFVRSYKTKNLTLLIILINLAIHFSFESMLSRYYGIALMALVFSILFVKGSRSEIEATP